jgi:RND family efflux transporter MFP subunit
MESNRPATPRRTWLWLAIGALVVIALAAQGIWSRRAAHASLQAVARDTSRPSVSVIRAQRISATQDLVLPGNVQAFADTPIYARTNGYLRVWYADLGAHVKRGQLLAEIDTPEVDDQLRQARADLDNAQANYALAKSTAERWTEMLGNHSVSRQETDEKVGDMLAKKATLDAAKFNVARLQKLQSFQKIYAPFDGIVTARNVDVGALIDAGSAGGPARELFHIAQADRMRVYVNVPQAYAQQVRPGLAATLTLPELPSKRFAGKTSHIAGAIDATQRTMLTEVDFANATGELLPGAYAEVHFALSAPPGTAGGFTLPGNTLLFRPDGVHVATVDANQRVRLIRVTLGIDYGTRVAIASGLNGDERVIVSPQDSIVDGQPVRVVAARAPGASGTATGGGG